jgi:hypothetical protein
MLTSTVVQGDQEQLVSDPQRLRDHRATPNR